MYINPFIGGVLATLFTEVVIVLGVAIYYTIKRNNGGKR